MSDKLEWIEWIDPLTNDLKFINLKTGDCSSNVPINTEVYKADDPNQWWQLYDSKSGQYYYYNRSKQKTLWQRPLESNARIIQLSVKSIQQPYHHRYHQKPHQTQSDFMNGSNSVSTIGISNPSTNNTIIGDYNKENKFQNPPTATTTATTPITTNTQVKRNDVFDFDFIKCDQQTGINKKPHKDSYDTMSLKSLRPRTLTLTGTNSTKNIHTTATQDNQTCNTPTSTTTGGKAYANHHDTSSPIVKKNYSNFIENSSTLYDTKRLAPASLVSPTQVSKPKDTDLSSKSTSTSDYSNSGAAQRTRLTLNRHRSQTITSSTAATTTPPPPSQSNDKISLKELNELKRNLIYNSRRKLPRTNPNYVNVDLVCDDGTVKNTYVRFDKSPNYQLLHTSFVNPLNNMSPQPPSSPTLSTCSSSFCSTSTGSHYQPFMTNSLNLQQTPSPSITHNSTRNHQSNKSTTPIAHHHHHQASQADHLVKSTTSTAAVQNTPPVKSPSTNSQLCELNKSVTSLSPDEQQQQQQQQQQNRKSNFTSSSKTLCNYPYLDDNLSLKFNDQHGDGNGVFINEYDDAEDVDDVDDDEHNYDDAYVDDVDSSDYVMSSSGGGGGGGGKNGTKELSVSFNNDDLVNPSPLLKHKTMNNTISYPSLNRRNLDRISKRVAGRVIDGDLYLNSDGVKNVYNQSPISFVNELFRPNSVFVGTGMNSNLAPSDNLSIKSAAVSLQRTLTHPRSPNPFLSTNSSTSSLHHFGPQHYQQQQQQHQSLSQYQQQQTSTLTLQNPLEDILNTHKKGGLFFSKKLSSNDLLKWSKDPIQKPLIRVNDKLVKKEAPELFKLVQVYMGDRKTKSLDLKQICLDIMIKGWSIAILRDELYLQLIKQTNFNENNSSLNYGWELMCICLSFFPPSQKFYPYLLDYIQAHLDGKYDTLDCEASKYARTCVKRLDRIHSTGAKKGLKKPTLDEIELSRNTISGVSLFGTTLNEIMAIQNLKCPELRLPWIQTSLSEAVLRLNGARTEGIFRVPGDLDEVNSLKVKYDKIWCSEDFCSKNLHEINVLDTIEDPHLPASLLKLWYRELYEPLIPNEYYHDCIRFCDNPYECIKIIEKLPQINRYVFTYLVKFLKAFATIDNVGHTKMDANNLSMIMAPNCLRCESDDPKTIMENTKKEMMFIKTLIQNLDTSILDDFV